jgi:cyclic pyranopterin monophosphate synthase
MSEFSHIDESGRASMVDVGDKDASDRQARARGFVYMAEETLEAINQRRIAKGEVLQVARIAGISAAKRTFELIPMCHLLALDNVAVAFRLLPQVSAVAVEATVRCHGKTGVEMEALTAVSTAALTIYDMCKAVDKAMHIGDVHLVEKTGGTSGPFAHPQAPGPEVDLDDEPWE